MRKISKSLETWIVLLLLLTVIYTTNLFPLYYIALKNILTEQLVYYPYKEDLMVLPQVQQKIVLKQIDVSIRDTFKTRYRNLDIENIKLTNGLLEN